MSKLILFALTMFSMNAFSDSLWICDSPDAGYSYSITNLQATTLPLPTQIDLTIEMNSTGATQSVVLTLSHEQSSEGAIYGSNETDVQVIYSVAPQMPGMPSRYVSIRKMVGGVEFKGRCNFKRP